MKKILFFILLMPMFSFGQDTLSATSEQRNFCLNVVKSIIEHDCEEYYESLSEDVVLYQSVRDTLISKSVLRPKLLTLCNISVRNDSLEKPNRLYTRRRI